MSTAIARKLEPSLKRTAADRRERARIAAGLAKLAAGVPASERRASRRRGNCRRSWPSFSRPARRRCPPSSRACLGWDSKLSGTHAASVSEHVVGEDIRSRYELPRAREAILLPITFPSRKQCYRGSRFARTMYARCVHLEVLVPGDLPSVLQMSTAARANERSPNDAAVD